MIRGNQETERMLQPGRGRDRKYYMDEATNEKINSIRSDVIRCEAALHSASIAEISQTELDAVPLIDLAGMMLYRIECAVTELLEDTKPPELYNWIDL